MAPAHGADNVVPDNEDSGGPSLPHRGYPMWASKKKVEQTGSTSGLSEIRTAIYIRRGIGNLRQATARWEKCAKQLKTLKTMK